MFGRRREEYRPRRESWTTPGGEYSMLAAEVLSAPHTLIAGTTGCGKSTFLHSVMQALLVQNSPVKAALVLIDPKKVELADYAGLPHVLRYAEEADEAEAALRYACALMESRYTSMKARGERMFSGAHVYIIIDELADLMLSARKHEIERLLQRLLQLGRAAAISVIACTQCPNRRVLKAELVCNFTNRFGLRCLSAIESRQIVGEKGCELLPEHGQAIYVHGCHKDLYNLPYVKFEDVLPLIRYWTSARAKAV